MTNLIVNWLIATGLIGCGVGVILLMALRLKDRESWIVSSGFILTAILIGYGTMATVDWLTR